MTAKYLLRFDDLAPTSNWPVWDRVEELLVSLDAKPIVAVVPDNRDEKLVVSDPDPAFWDRVRRWQSLGWTIGLHGYQHVTITRDAGIIGMNARSEFAGVPEREQRHKLDSALSIMEREGVNVDAWVAPFHSFDLNTLNALADLGLDTISDGLGLYPYSDDAGRTWIPQQLWGVRRISLGVATICNHINGWKHADVDAFASNVRRIADSLTDVRTVKRLYASRGRWPLESLAWRVVLSASRLRSFATRTTPAGARRPAS